MSEPRERIEAYVSAYKNNRHMNDQYIHATSSGPALMLSDLEALLAENATLHEASKKLLNNMVDNP